MPIIIGVNRSSVVDWLIHAAVYDSASPAVGPFENRLIG